MKKIDCFLFSALFCISLVPINARAQTYTHSQSSAPELFGVGEVIIDYAQFDDPQASESCSLSRKQVASILANSFKGTMVPATPIIDVKPPTANFARIHLIPQISTYVIDSLNCVSWVSLSAENRVIAVIPPVNAPRNVTVIYWRQHTRALSGQSGHAEKVAEALKKMADQFAQQYRIDQPSASQK